MGIKCAIHKYTVVVTVHVWNTHGTTGENIVQWTDGCASQYKSKGPVVDILCGLEDFGYTSEQNFFRSKHTMGLSDG